MVHSYCERDKHRSIVQPFKFYYMSKLVVEDVASIGDGAEPLVPDLPGCDLAHD